MASITMRCKVVVLAAMMAASSSHESFSMARFVPSQKAITVAATVAGLATWVRLNSKGSSWDYTTENWRADFELFLNSLNIFDAESRATLLNLFDKWIVGRQLSIIDVAYKTTDETGMVTTRKEKKVKAKPFGLMGLFDAYVLFQLKKINENVKEIHGINTLINDPVVYITKINA